MALKNGDRFVTILLKNGVEFGVEGICCEDVATVPVGHHNGWAHFTLTNGNTVQIWAGEIAAIYESEVGLE